MREKIGPETRGTGTPSPIPLDEWERGWQAFWKDAGFTPYELLTSDQNAAQREYQFLMTARTPKREMERLTRIQDEFVGGFSAHAGQKDLLTWFGAIAPSQPRVVLIHGEDGPRTSLASLIRQRHGLPCVLPKQGDVIDV